MTRLDPSHNGAAATPKPARRRGPIGVLLDVFSSIWLGVTLLSLLFVYSSIGSAMPFVRELPLFEKTEFEWFHWWPFNLLIALICINLVVATLRRIPFTVLRFGVWMIHTGIIVLALGSAYYFMTKVEGDTPVIRRQVVIEAPGHQPVTIPALPGSRAVIGEGDNRYEFQVVSIRPDWPILSDEHLGRSAYSVSLAVETPERRFVRQLLDGYPQYTEDVIPGEGRAVRITGERLVDRDLKLSLDVEPQTHFFLMHSRALYLREVGSRDWSERPIHGLPRYNDYVSSLDEVWSTGVEGLPARPINVPVKAKEAGDPLPATVRITNYLRYAVPDERFGPGGNTLNPVAHVRLQAATGATRDYQLQAFDPVAYMAEQGRLQFHWLREGQRIEEFGEERPGGLTVRVPGVVEQPIEISLDRTLADDETLEFTPIEGTEYSYRVRFLANHLPLEDGSLISTAGVEIRTPDRAFQRWVTDDPRFARDMPMHSGDAHMHDTLPLDEGIEFLYTPPPIPARFVVVGGPEATSPVRLAVFDRARGETQVEELRPQQPIELGQGVRLALMHMFPHARAEVRPAIIPPRQRDREAGELFSMIKVEIEHEGQVVSEWLPYHRYVFKDANYAYRGRFRYEPMRVDLPNGRSYELLFSRKRKPLPAPVVLDDFILTTHVGGFTGEMSSIRDWTSEVRFLAAEGPSDTLTISTNNPAEFNRYWFFQSMWDRPEAGRPGVDEGSAGLNFTGLGVGNRNGVYIQLAGCCLAVFGMIYAFYIKPIIRRRRMQSALAAAAKRGALGDSAEAAAAEIDREAFQEGAATREPTPV